MRLRGLYGLVPIFADHTLGVAILSYDGRVTFTVNADRDGVRDLAVFPIALEESLAELRAVASAEPWTASRSATRSPTASSPSP